MWWEASNIGVVTSASHAYIYYFGQGSLKLCIPKKFVQFSACYGPSLLALSVNINLRDCVNQN